MESLMVPPPPQSQSCSAVPVDLNHHKIGEGFWSNFITRFQNLNINQSPLGKPSNTQCQLGVAYGKSETRRDAETGILKSETELEKFSDLNEKHIGDWQTQNLRLRDPLVGNVRDSETWVEFAKTSRFHRTIHHPFNYLISQWQCREWYTWIKSFRLPVQIQKKSEHSRIKSGNCVWRCLAMVWLNKCSLFLWIGSESLKLLIRVFRAIARLKI